MDFQQVIHMNGGEGENSYALNSGLQSVAASKAKRFLRDAVLDLYCQSFPHHHQLTIADLGCSSGPNTITVVSDIVDAIDEVCCRLNHPLPEFQVFLNDLPGNDFNTLFNKYIPQFYEKLKKRDGFRSCCIAGVAGSFHGRIFPSNTLHFVHSSFSVQWLSQFPQGVENNKGNIYITTTSPPTVSKAYLEQFQKDFSLFLSSRSSEVITRGRMVITMPATRSSDPNNRGCDVWSLLSKALRDMVLQGRIEEDELDSFNAPFYMPCVEEVRSIIETEGSFEIDRIETFDVSWIVEDDKYGKTDLSCRFRSGHYTAKRVRAIAEPILAERFGHAVINDLFSSFPELVAEELVDEMAEQFVITVCMIKKG